MNWDQIESKWAAMTRRVQAGWQPRVALSDNDGAARPARAVSVAVADLLVVVSRPNPGAPTAE